MLQMGDTVGPLYTAPKISAISYLFGTLSLLIMGDTERPRYTGFHGLSVRGITALQCILLNSDFRDYPTWALQVYFIPNQYPVTKSPLHYTGQGVI